MKLETDWLKQWTLYSPQKIAIKDGDTGQGFSYETLYTLANRIAAWLRDAHKIEKGDRVAVLAFNEIDYVPIFFAVQRLGAVMVPINFRLAPREVGHILKDCAPKLLLCQNSFREALEKVDRSTLPPQCEYFEGEGKFVAPFQKASDARDIIEMDFEAETPCLILYTSGTTGLPKGAILTYGMLFWNSVNTALRLNITSTDITVMFLPFYHTSGWNVLSTPLLHHGARVIFIRKFDAEKVLQLCDSEKATILFGVPTTMDMMAQSKTFSKVALKTLRYAIVGGEPMPIELIRVWGKKGIPIRQGFGLTEFGPNVFSLNEEDAIRKIGSIGFPNFYIEAKIVDESERELGTDEIGELVLKGTACTPGYWNNPQATASAIKDGWFHTGDLVRRDAEGYYYVVGRKKDMFISGGENVYPAEVEQCLSANPKIREAAVIGVPDAKWGEVGKAFIVLTPGATLSADEIIEYCKANLAKYKVPKYIQFMAELPKGDTGKILKRQLKEQEKSQ